MAETDAVAIVACAELAVGVISVESGLEKMAGSIEVA